jgi:hypothetical protein
MELARLLPCLVSPPSDYGNDMFNVLSGLMGIGKAAMIIPSFKSDDIYRQLIMPEEDRRAHPTAPQWTGGYRWFRSANIVDLQNYRSPAEKIRIQAVILFQKKWP